MNKNLSMAAKGASKKLQPPGAGMAAVSDKKDLLITRSTTEQVLAVNQRLVAEIETLKLKMEMEAAEFQKSKQSLEASSQQKIRTRELEIENLRGQLETKGAKVKKTAQAVDEKDGKIGDLHLYIEILKEDVRESKQYASQIQEQLDCLLDEKSKLETGEAYKEKDEEIEKLQTEVDSLRSNLKTLEHEIIKSKEIIAQNGSRLRHVENDRNNMQIQFKEELAKVSKSMRYEVEKIRDVMTFQWTEMRNLREENEGLRGDIRDIKDLLIADIQNDQQQQQGQQQQQRRNNADSRHPQSLYFPAFDSGRSSRKSNTGRTK